MTASHIGTLERGEIRWPNGDYRSALCAVFEMTEDALGLYIDRPQRAGREIETTAPPVDREWPMPSNQALLSDIEFLRNNLDAHLGRGRQAVHDRIDELDLTADNYAQQCVSAPPVEMLHRLKIDLDHVASLLTDQDITVRHRLLRVVARLAALIADEFMVLGAPRKSAAWHVTARAAADESGDIRLRAAVRTLGALLPLYLDDAPEAIRLTREAGILCGDRDLAAVLAPTYESLALARLGLVPESERALAAARRQLAGLDAKHALDSVFGLSPARWCFYEGKILSYLGRADEAWAIHDEALARYPRDIVGDPAMIRFDQSISLVRGKQVAAGCQLAEQSLAGLPEAHRTPLFVQAARRVVGAIPAPYRDTAPAVRLRLAIDSTPPAV